MLLRFLPVCFDVFEDVEIGLDKVNFSIKECGKFAVLAMLILLDGMHVRSEVFGGFLAMMFVFS